MTEEKENVKAIKDQNNNFTSSKISEKYGLRPRTIIKRLQIEKKRHLAETCSRREPKKPKPAPLSKYRRKTANARERHRMKEINDAFTTLRGILPAFGIRRPSSSGMTKITTLKMATNYIQTLSDVLKEMETNPEECGTFVKTFAHTEIEDFLSDDSCMLENDFSAFNDIPMLPEADQFSLLLSSEGELTLE